MKKSVIILAASILLISCKDKKKDDPEPTAPANQVSVKINGSDFSCSTCGNTYKSGGLSGVNFREGTSNRFIFNISDFLKPGTYVMGTGTNPSFTYEKDGSYYHGKGVLILTATDTSANGSLKKFIGTFNCKTDTVNGKSFEFSDGVLNINFN